MGLPGRAVTALLIGKILIITTVWAQTTPAAAPPPAAPDVGGNAEVALGAGPRTSDFISFEEGTDDTDIFRYEKKEYLIVSDKRTYQQAEFTCKEFNARLAYFETLDVAEFVAEALSETRLYLDTLWVAGVRDHNKNNDTDAWQWNTENGKENLTKELIQITVPDKDLKIEAGDRECLGFGRLNHDVPQLRPLTCKGRRTLICQRARGDGGKGNSTHPGWIKIGPRLYKIYADKIGYEAGEEQCAMHKEDASLAVIVSYEDAQMLGRYLLIGRPSLENAWIGGKWTGDSYKFEQESLLVHNITDASTKYPPWRNERMRKPKGCLLLDRHLANITLFVEARCDRERAIICYRMEKNETDDVNKTDVIIDAFGYRLIYSPPKPWEPAKDFCLTKYKDYSAKLVEIDKPVHKTNLLYVMGENKTAVQHIWIGGHFDENKWQWVSGPKDVDVSMLDWVKNGSWEKVVEEGYICLNMDRENHVAALHYGAGCKFPQPFVCQFDADQLRRLQQDEAHRRQRAEDVTVPPKP